MIGALFHSVSRCVRFCREQREQTPARAIHADLSEFRSADGGQKVKQDKEQASSVAPCSVTSARSAGSYGGFRAFQSGVKIEGVLSLLRSLSPRAYSYRKKVGVMPRKRCYFEQKGHLLLCRTPERKMPFCRRTHSRIASQNKE